MAAIYFVTILLFKSFIAVLGLSRQNISFTSFFNSIGRRYSCPGEFVTYVCSGTGNEMDIFAPPFINDTARLIFSNTDRIGTGLGTGAIGAFLLSAEGASISVGVVVRDSDLNECNITCEVHSQIISEDTTVTHRPSAPPMGVTSPNIESVGTLNNPDLSAVNISWNANAEKFDLKHYIVTVYSSEGNAEIVSVNITSKRDTVSVVLPVPREVLIRANITTMSMCDQTDGGVSTDEILSTSSSITLQCAFVLLFSAVIAAVALVM